MSEAKARCAHTRVTYRTQEARPGLVVRGWWACVHCETEFVPSVLARVPAAPAPEPDRLDEIAQAFTPRRHPQDTSPAQAYESQTIQDIWWLIAEVRRLRAAPAAPAPEDDGLRPMCGLAMPGTAWVCGMDPKHDGPCGAAPTAPADAPRRIRIREADPEYNMWFNGRVGEEFEVRGWHPGVPNQWEVFDPKDVSTARGKMFVPEYFAAPADAPPSEREGLAQTLDQFADVICPRLAEILVPHGATYEGWADAADQLRRCAAIVRAAPAVAPPRGAPQREGETNG